MLLPLAFPQCHRHASFPIQGLSGQGRLDDERVYVSGQSSGRCTESVCLQAIVSGLFSSGRPGKALA